MSRALAMAALLALGACSDPKFDEASQIGPNPVLGNTVWRVRRPFRA